MPETKSFLLKYERQEIGMRVVVERVPDVGLLLKRPEHGVYPKPEDIVCRSGKELNKRLIEFDSTPQDGNPAGHRIFIMLFNELFLEVTTYRKKHRKQRNSKAKQG